MADDKNEAVYVSSLAKALLQARGREELERTPEYLTEGAKLLRAVYGADMGAYVARQDETVRFRRWCRGLDLPAPYEAKGLVAAIEVTQILLGRMSRPRAKEWMTAPHSYILDLLPMDVIREDADLVKRAASQNWS